MRVWNSQSCTIFNNVFNNIWNPSGRDILPDVPDLSGIYIYDFRFGEVTDLVAFNNSFSDDFALGNYVQSGVLNAPLGESNIIQLPATEGAYWSGDITN